MEISRVHGTRVTVPKGVRKALSLKDGDYLSFEVLETGEVYVKKIIISRPTFIG